MKITLIRPYYMHNPYEPPLGVAILAGYLEEKGYSVSIIDFEAAWVKSKDKIKKHIEAEDPDIVGVSFFTYDRFEAVKVANAAKELGKVVIGGGLHITFDPINTLQSIPSIDIGVLGEGEETLFELVKVLEEDRSLQDIEGIAYRRNGKVVINQLRPLISNLDSLPMPAYHLLPMVKYPYHQILGSRGCSYNCIFCASPEFWRRRVRFRTYKIVVDEIEYLIKNYGQKEFDFKDDVLFLNKEWTKNLCNELLERNIDIRWNCLGRADVIDEPLFKLMRKAGCETLRFGIESGNERILRVINKNITKQQVRHAVKVAKEIPFEVGTLFMLGHPSETMDEMEETCQFAVELSAEHYSFKPTDVYPGTQLFHIAVKEGLLPKEYNWFEKGRYKAGFLTYDDVPSYESSQFSRGPLEDTAKKFYLRTFFARAFTLKSLSDFNISRFRTEIGFIPKSSKDFRIFVSEVIRELRIKRTLKQRFLGIVVVTICILRKGGKAFYHRFKKSFQLGIRRTPLAGTLIRHR